MSAQTTAGSALAELTRTHTREMLRDKKAAAGSVGIPAFFLVLFVALPLLTDPGPEHTLLRRMLPMAMFFVLGSLVFFGTVSPAVELRQRGTLRLLSSTPLRPSTFLLALAPARLLLAVVFVATSAVISAAFGELPTGRLPVLLLTSLCGLVFLLGSGFAFAARLASGETASNLLSLVLVVLLFLAGGLVELSTLPGSVGTVLGWLPPALLLDGLAYGLVGSPVTHPVAVGELVLLVVGGALAAAAVRAFRWNRSTDS